MNRPAIAAFERVVALAKKGRPEKVDEMLVVALGLWGMPKSRLPRWFKKGARVSVVCDQPDGRSYVVRVVRYDRVLREHGYTLQGECDAMSGTICGYESVFPFRHLPPRVRRAPP